MKINQMQAFNELMLTGSVSEAARNLNRSQPAISALISNLEDDFGMKLFERKGGRLHPVPEAYYLKEECSELLGRIDSIQRSMRGIKALNSGKLEIASMPGPSVFLLPNLIADFAKGKPNIECALTSRGSDAVFQLVAAQQFDLGISDYFYGKAEKTSLVSERIFKFNCFCAIQKDHILAKKKFITTKDLDNEPLGTLYDEHEISSNTRKVFSDAGHRMNVKFTTQYFIPLLTYVEKKLAFGIVDPITVESYRLNKGDDADIVFLPFKPQVYYHASVLTPDYRPASLLIQSFTDKLIEEFKRLGGIHIN